MAARIGAPLLIALWLAGCAATGPVLPAPDASISVDAVPFFPQAADRCGPAALASALAHSGVETAPDALERRIYLPGRGGSLQPEMVAAARAHGRTAYTFEGRPAHLLDVLRENRPVIVLQNLGTRWLPYWHYAVVIGYRRDADAFVMRSGTVANRTMSRRELLRRWRASGYWALVVLKPGEIPAGAAADAYLDAVSAHEALGQWEAARLGYSAAVERWPHHALARFGLANVRLATGAPDAAIRAYRKVLELDPDHVPALNNLAYACAGAGRSNEALATIDRALRESVPDDVRADLVALRTSLRETH